MTEGFSVGKYSQLLADPNANLRACQQRELQSVGLTGFIAVSTRVARPTCDRGRPAAEGTVRENISYMNFWTIRFVIPMKPTLSPCGRRSTFDYDATEAIAAEQHSDSGSKPGTALTAGKRGERAADGRVNLERRSFSCLL